MPKDDLGRMAQHFEHLPTPSDRPPLRWLLLAGIVGGMLFGGTGAARGI